MPNPGPLTCKYCGKKFKQNCRLRVHQQIHTGKKNFKCNLCTYSTNTYDLLTNHIRSHTKEKPFHCPHPNCSLTFSTKRGLNRHALVHNKTDEKFLKFRCQVANCGYKTITKDRLTSHMRVHSTLKPFACDLCPFRAKGRGTLAKHLQNVHSTEKPFKCPEENCNYYGKDKYALAKHLKIHSDERAFPCSFPGCAHKSKRKGDLRKHMRVHTGERLFKCSFCPRAFADKSNLTTHTRIHTGERPYSCPNCPFRSKVSNSLAIHIQTIHTSERPYPCQRCPYRAKTSDSLRAHTRVHTDERPFHCQSCPYRAKTKHSVIKHFTRWHSENNSKKRPTLSSRFRPFNCTVSGCGYSTKENSSFAIHLNNVHKLPKVIL